LSAFYFLGIDWVVIMQKMLRNNRIKKGQFISTRPLISSHCGDLKQLRWLSK